jgi:hypothetical protein
MEAHGMDAQQQEEFLKQRASIADFVKNDFTFPLGQYLKGFKDVYAALKIAVPILALLLVFVLVMIGLTAYGLPAKFKWLGATFLTTAIFGYGVIFMKSYIISAFTALSMLDQASYLALITPILIAILRYFMDSYLTFQGIANIVMLIASAVCFVAAVITRKTAPTAIKPLQIKPSYWEKPSRKNK